ncbi:MAG: hypothetical protein Q9228_006405 [Teloschistes exilis]
MTTFQSVNVGLGPHEHAFGVTTPTTPRAPVQHQSQPQSQHQPATIAEEQSTTTPTRLSFGGLSGQRPLPTSPFRSSFSSQLLAADRPTSGVLSRGNSHTSTQSTVSEDVDMNMSDEGEVVSDDESVDAETGRPSKKKKGQKFYCTDFPPCNLSFTRSEHLARHIRFSRLDNLRQHAQTVHVNEEIPGDSLAATGTRFQRQIRTDRVRTPTGRSRASTAGSQGSHSRGHSRNLSASSIGSTASTISISRGEDTRRRPPPLIMSSDQNIRIRPTIDTFAARPMTPPSQQGFSKESSEGLSTPTSTTFSNGASSPGYGSTFGSPVSTVSRTGGYWGSSNYHGRRLSVPSGPNPNPNPFQSPHANSYPNPYLSPLAPSNSSLASSNSSAFGSPTGSTYAFPRRETPEEIELRRRTWHSSTYHNYPRPATSGLSYYRTPDDAPQPGFAPQAAATPRRLPGIEAFDMPNRNSSPIRCGGSPMQLDAPSKPPIYPGPLATSGPNDRRGHASWDLSLHQNLTKLDIANNNTPPREPEYWGRPSMAQQQQPSDNNEYPIQPPQSSFQPQSTPVIVHHNSHHEKTDAANPPSATPYRAKRQGWYNGPLNAPQPKVAQRSPEGSSSSEGVSTPSFSTAECNPSIVTSDGYIEPHPPAHEKTFNDPSQPYTYQYPVKPHNATPQHPNRSQQENNMTGLDVLVAVATNEDNARNTTTGQSPPIR